MASVDHFLAMGGYARFVWSAWGVAVIVLGGLLIDSVTTYRKRRRELDAAEKTAMTAPRAQSRRVRNAAVKS